MLIVILSFYRKGWVSEWMGHLPHTLKVATPFIYLNKKLLLSIDRLIYEQSRPTEKQSNFQLKVSER